MVSPDDDGAAYHEFVVTGEQAGQRLDKALTQLASAAGLALSRSRLGALVADGAVEIDGAKQAGPARRVRTGERICLTVPPPIPARPQPEAIPLDIVHEDAAILVVNKPVGMVVHPAPGAEAGTLVNALLAHCGPDLPGIGGERRPGIVHRIDKDTSGLLVVAKTEAAMGALAALFAAHGIHRRYLALGWGAPDRADPRLASIEGVSFTRDGALRVETRIGRDPADRKRMAVLGTAGRNAVSFIGIRERFGGTGKPFACLMECRLETGRTHQIRVHAAHIGAPLIGDPVYGRARSLPRSVDAALQAQLRSFPRQALHAAELGFRHPETHEMMRFQADLPSDMNDLLMNLRRNGPTVR